MTSPRLAFTRSVRSSNIGTMHHQLLQIQRQIFTLSHPASTKCLCPSIFRGPVSRISGHISRPSQPLYSVVLHHCWQLNHLPALFLFHLCSHINPLNISFSVICLLPPWSSSFVSFHGSHPYVMMGRIIALYTSTLGPLDNCLHVSPSLDLKIYLFAFASLEFNHRQLIIFCQKRA